ncbi:tRNA (adenosine(37)-N6)-threonylcarbamoyltransferase complex transferase subunit TsaD [Candidatus Kaiserbacteria bacterium RIFCSPHIGHO2_01_FULL_50_13]|uniref:tRNA N6-adenosine threonylcarbamoyltransferase n=1 Tax=Candidatus Kaiserbacteria bacterium RIFCSPLOWO2_01_FULL_50_24 TaxID=1798507 RepID=A0A1F6ENF0_9BACT|nr:MAG: tRNA (adenosine(37)-N6)-threonylcarbamoyltransferase complex transferase subunit TsaD [Candidatus Kaiserbacteria bacterium RIFCSPHIGHO2_01_FULL_50_13]OGG75165.1 MAG: tRNA (adenosine(37)-N6)-threonylcarbamoyltransferase complex transferase subunit TsaD [Candidatus Kaiserbacteria bacterium RIFCSPLOWO2_01_FULL_50_24]OGG81045.1 MAG: tRNA (adenosine(37)-N6)-threonylcarbamoyltransferase complex transferase subunit TsaD [Candidatus Kaiserbacteria bacterium RIFCSPLOWO2_02_FULL_51_13]
MKVLAFETSCDETGIALVYGEKIPGGFVFKTLKSALLSQAALHAPYGGVYPNLAKREHEKNLPMLYKEFESEPADAIAVTQGPGLEPALWQGIQFAKKIAREGTLPLLAINHMEAHLVSSLAQPKIQHSNVLKNIRMFELRDTQLPVLALLISGGHTEFVLMREWFTYEVIGRTLDDAVGECFDKVARMLDLPYPGGPEISRIALEARKKKLEAECRLPRPMIHSNNLNVSFSGLKTAALYALRDKQLTEDERAAFAAEFEDAVADVFVSKTQKALKETGAKTFVIGGGVAANHYIRKRLERLVLNDFPNIEFRLPDPSITGDNAIMIAQCALAHLTAGHWNLETESAGQEIKAVGNLSIAG